MYGGGGANILTYTPFSSYHKLFTYRKHFNAGEKNSNKADIVIEEYILF